METEDKFYSVKPLSDRALSRNQPRLVRWNPTLHVEVDESIDHAQYISLTLVKAGYGDMNEPVSTGYEKVTPVLKENFLNHYSLAIEYLQKTPLDEGAFYLYQSSGHSMEVAWYSKNEKKKANFIIDFADDAEDLWLRVSSSTGYPHRPKFRKKGRPITNDRFRQFFNLTLEFLHDSNCYSVLEKDYISKFYLVASEMGSVDRLLISAEKLTKIIDELEKRGNSIAKRLIENDNDSATERAKLRGELEGLGYAIKAIKGANGEDSVKPFQ
jgi:hypothetical protein